MNDTKLERRRSRLRAATTLLLACLLALLNLSSTLRPALAEGGAGSFQIFMPVTSGGQADPAEAAAAEALMQPMRAMEKSRGVTFNTLARALIVSGVALDLLRANEFTLFAPTDAAFKKLPAETVQSLLKRENREKLRSLLRYHALAARVKSADAIKLAGQSVTTLNGEKIAIKTQGSDLFINDAKVIAADTEFLRNGVIHVLDGVLIPPSFTAPSKDIVDTAVAAGNFKTLVAAVQAAGLVDALKAPGPFTVFAPTDEAFAKLPPGVVAYLLKPENKEALRSLLLYHVLNGAVSSEQAKRLSAAHTLNGKPVHISFNGVNLFVNGAKVVSADVKASNGVIHAIDTVLVPNLSAGQVLDAAGTFKTFQAAMQAAGLKYLLDNDFSAFGGVTFFPPTDAAFAKLPPGTVETLLKPENRDTLRRILLWHIGVTRRTGLEIAYNRGIHSYLGVQLKAEVVDGALLLNNRQSKVILADLNARGAIIHGIDTVMTPPQH